MLIVKFQSTKVGRSPYTVPLSLGGDRGWTPGADGHSRSRVSTLGHFCDVVCSSYGKLSITLLKQPSRQFLNHLIFFNKHLLLGLKLPTGVLVFCRLVPALGEILVSKILPVSTGRKKRKKKKGNKVPGR